MSSTWAPKQRLGLKPLPRDLGFGYQVDGDVVFVDLDVGVFPRRGHQGPFDFAAGHVVGMENPPLAVSPFTGQVVAVAAGGELYPPVDQVADDLRPFLDHHPHHVFVADAGAGHQGVFDMGIEGVLLGEDRCDATLGIVRGGFGDFPLGDHRDLAVFGRLQRKGETGDTAADDEKIAFNFHGNSV